VVVIIAILGGVIYAAASKAATPVNASYFTSGLPGAKCMDVYEDGTANYTKVDIYGCNKSAAQQWTINTNGTIENANGACLDLSGARYTNNTKIVVYKCNTNPAQQWKVNGSTLENPTAQKCIDDPYSNEANNTQLIIYTCKGTNNQKWVASTSSNESGSTGSSTSGTGNGGASTGSQTIGSGSGTFNSSCTNPSFTNTDNNGQSSQASWTNDGYIVGQDVWSPISTSQQSLYACSYHSWYVVGTEPTSSNGVRSYPNVLKNMTGTVSSYSTLTSSYADQGPHVGSYEFAYDIWINGGPGVAGSTELMIWNDNYNQYPAGSQVNTTTIGNTPFAVYRRNSGGNETVSFKDTGTQLTSGTWNLLSFFTYMENQGWITSSATLKQICYGVEIVRTENAGVAATAATYKVTNFNINSAN
jgi:hypothetical protein